jgi:hypothetical protein
MAVIWTVSGVRRWREIFFLNIRNAARAGPALSATATTIAALTRRGLSPESLINRRVVARFIVAHEGLSRSRLESADHLTVLEKAKPASQR